MNDWEKIQRILNAIILAAATIGFGVMVAMWISI